MIGRTVSQTHLGALPSGRHREEQCTTGWKILFFDPPSIQGSPIKEVDVVVPNNGDVLRSLTVEYPQSHRGCNPGHPRPN